jgi:hypothetical protein
VRSRRVDNGEILIVEPDNEQNKPINTLIRRCCHPDRLQRITFREIILYLLQHISQEYLARFQAVSYYHTQVHIEMPLNNGN